MIKVKVLGALALIDEGETDWKIVTIDVEDPLANDIVDLERLNKFGCSSQFIVLNSNLCNLHLKTLFFFQPGEGKTWLFGRHSRMVQDLQDSRGKAGKSCNKNEIYFSLITYA